MNNLIADNYHRKKTKKSEITKEIKEKINSQSRNNKNSLNYHGGLIGLKKLQS